MAQFEILMPKLGESIEEATITKWFVKENDIVDEDDTLLEIATDKVDSEIPSPVAGKIKKILYNENDLVAVGEVIATILLEGTEDDAPETSETPKSETVREEKESAKGVQADISFEKSERFYSPLVKSIAKTENVSLKELEAIKGTGQNDRVSKIDILNYISTRADQKVTASNEIKPAHTPQPEKQKVNISVGANDEIIAMDRMRKLIGDHMVNSVKVSPHVTSMVETDVTNVVLWRNKVKNQFFDREKEKITFLPIFIEAMARALKDFPMVNSSTDGENIILRKDINIGIAVALPTGNLIVPVIKKADQLNLLGITKELNRLANAARENNLKPDDIQGGTFSVSNFGSFKNVMGTPIINQPQVAIMAVGTIEKKPAVVETETGDIIAIRHKMFLSLSYDHRVVDGALGGAFIRKVADYIEEFDLNRSI